MTLYELTAEYAGLLDAYYSAETDAEAAEALEKLEAACQDITAKANAYARLIRNVDGEIKALKAEEKRLNDARKAREKMVERLKGNMLFMMETTGTAKLETIAGKWSVQNNPFSCEITNADAVPERFKSYRTEVDIDKKAMIDEFRESGEIFDGCIIVQKLGVRFR